MSSRSHCQPGVAADPLSLSLLDAATAANESAVLDALVAGADVNALDASGRTVVGCVLAGKRWDAVDVLDASYALQTRLRILKSLMSHDKISLYALNAPQSCMRGVTPLGLAAWLNIPEMVKMLLEHSPGLVSVDGMDTLGATPLMYAARDGGVAVVQSLLSHGARPDFRDVNHRSSVQHALRHPQVLWLCESALRRHRAHETVHQDNKRNLSQLSPELDELLAAAPRIACHPRLALNPPKQTIRAMTDRLVAGVRATDVQRLHSLLFPSTSSTSPVLPHPYLVNYPDAQGWSPIHYCVSAEKPSLTILDILYRAGADMSLYAQSGHGAPLHCLAYNARASMPSSIRTFVNHLVVDLRAPLSARDESMETCIHIAAEHGQSLDVLVALLSCDTTRKVRELRNARGLTALDVAKPQFRPAFGLNVEQARCASAASARTIKPSTTSVHSTSSLASVLFYRRPNMRTPSVKLRPNLTEQELETLPRCVLDQLRTLSMKLCADPEALDVSAVEDMLFETTSMGEDILMHMQACADDAARDLDVLKSKIAAVRSVVPDLACDALAKERERLLALERAWDEPEQCRRRTTDSDDSDRTAVSERGSPIQSFGAADPGNLGVTADFVPDRFDNPRKTHVDSEPPTARFSGTPLQKNLRPVRSMVNLGHHTKHAPRPLDDRHILKLVPPWKESASRRSKDGDLTLLKRASAIMQTEKETGKHSASRVRAWFRRKLAPDTSRKAAAPRDVDQPIPEKSEDEKSSIELRDAYDATLVRRAKLIAVAQCDLSRIEECVGSAERSVASANRYMAQARKVFNAMVERLTNRLEHARLIQCLSDHLGDTVSDASCVRVEEESGPVEFPPITIPSSPRDSQLVFPRPPGTLSSDSSLISLSSTLIDGEEEEFCYLRILLTKRIRKRTDNAFTQIEKATTWLRIVREVTRPFKHQTITSPASH